MNSGFNVFTDMIIVGIIQLPFVFLLYCWFYNFQEEKQISQSLEIENNLETNLISEATEDEEEESSSSSSSSSVTSFTTTKASRVMNTRVIVGISILCMLSYFGQGSIGDWSALYFTEEFQVSPLISVIGLASFNMCLCIGTFMSDYITLYIGRKQLLIYAGFLSSIGLALVTLAPYLKPANYNHHEISFALILAILGFAIFGIGASVVPPSVISLAGNATLTGMDPNEAVALVSSVGYIGIMIGPAMLGSISGITGGLQWSFFVVALLMFFIPLITSCLPLNNNNNNNQSNNNNHKKEDEEKEVINPMTIIE
jgi:sugar phosphate permease